MAGTHSGREAVLGFLSREFEVSGGTYRVEVHDVLANDEHVVALTHATAERDDKLLDQNYAMVFHVADGRFIEVWPLAIDQTAVDQFWS